MDSACVEITETNEHMREGLRILARIIARDLMTGQAENEDRIKDGRSNENLQK